MLCFRQILIVSSFFTSSLAVQEWIEKPGYAEVNPGGSVILPCRVLNKKGECRWERNSLPVGVHPGKYEWATGSGVEDCSLRILSAEMEYDDGDWVCQVTASSFQNRDTLISEAAKLVVRVPPEKVYLRLAGESQALVGDLVAGAGEEVEVECVAEGGNPAPRLVWFLGSTPWQSKGEAIEQALQSQVSRVRIPVTREDHGTEVRCEVRHEALPEDKILMEAANLNIHYSPRVSIQPLAKKELTEGDSITLHCAVSANPPAQVEWRMEGDDQPISNGERLEIPRLTRSHTGKYICQAWNNIKTNYLNSFFSLLIILLNSQAKNSLGISGPQKIDLSVKYGAIVKSVEPAESNLHKMVGGSTKFVCHGEGNPTPTYRWIQVSASDHTEIVRSEDNLLNINDITFKDQGVYMCEVRNTIRGEHLVTRSEAVKLEVEGPPMLETKESNHYVVTGTDAKLEVKFCADPKPEVVWVRQGKTDGESGREEEILFQGKSDNFVINQLIETARKDCYTSVLTLKSPSKTENHEYRVKLKNQHGEREHQVSLRVGELLSQETLIGGLVGGLLALAIVLVVMVCCCRRFVCPKDPKTKQDIESPVSCSSSDVSSECQHSDVSSRTTTNTAVAAGGTSSGGVQNYHFGSVLSGEELYIEERMSGHYYEGGLNKVDLHNDSADRVYAGAFAHAQQHHRPLSVQSSTASSSYPQSSPNSLVSDNSQKNRFKPVVTTTTSAVFQNGGGPASRQNSQTAVNYKDLCFPKTSNYGSMRKQAKKAQFVNKSRNNDCFDYSDSSLTDINQQNQLFSTQQQLQQANNSSPNIMTQYTAVSV